MLLSDYVAALRGGWKIILGVLVVAIALSVIPTLRAETVYTSTTDLFVAASANTNDPEELFQRNAIASQRIPSYVTAASGNVVAGLVAEKLGRDLNADVVVEGISGTVVIRVSASGPDADQVREVAAAYADVLPGVIDEIEQVGDETSTQVKVTVVDTADAPTSSTPSFVPNLVLGLILGLGLGFVIVVLRETLRREQRAARAGTSAAETPES